MVELSAGGSVALGVIVGLVSTSVQSVGLTLQRKSHLLEEEKEDDYDRRPPYKRRRWQLGMLMFIVANIVGSTIQITTLPLPVLSTLQASGLVFNSICASVILSEPFTRYSLVGTLLVAAGALLIGIFGAITEPSHNLDQLLELLVRRQFIIWMIATAVIVISLLAANFLLKRAYHHRPPPRIRLLRGMFFGCISGILSAHSLLIAKSAVELLVRTIVDRHNEFNRWQSWMILIGLVAFALTQLYYMHCGLKLCSTSVLYPLVFCVYNIIAIIDGLIYFHQSSRLSNRDAGLITLGTAILLGGVVSLSWRLDEGPIEPTSPIAHKHGRIPTPQTVLTPGMGLVHALEDEPQSPDLDNQPPGAHGALFEQQRRRSADERTPLLARAPTAPGMGATPPSKKRLSLGAPQNLSPRASPSPRQFGRRRRMTISEETNEIWDELNDRENMPSPIRRSADFERRPRSGTLPNRPKHSSTTILSQMRRRSWWDALGGSRSGSISQGKKPVGSSEPLLNHPDPEDGDLSDLDAPPRLESNRKRGSWAFGDREAQKDQDGLGDWFKLRWWKKRRRESDEEGGGEGHDIP
ncbi:hypothetical protein P154DRAFT_437868 [Amniculicola lignicola CBS 123094]|uniref:DUF803-domain-containing protein n=1 Tax=Amniculicola lignicola CBS 123094 TaxID=1392246 RepID=A0A6A5WB35_9PLEO|nr:hypothetical protein P154DRAFT_437868 [Amniculicola lignicola CBS 123094]